VDWWEGFCGVRAWCRVLRVLGVFGFCGLVLWGCWFVGLGGGECVWWSWVYLLRVDWGSFGSDLGVGVWVFFMVAGFGWCVGEGCDQLRLFGDVWVWGWVGVCIAVGALAVNGVGFWGFFFFSCCCLGWVIGGFWMLLVCFGYFWVGCGVFGCWG